MGCSTSERRAMVDCDSSVGAVCRRVSISPTSGTRAVWRERPRPLGSRTVSANSDDDAAVLRLLDRIRQRIAPGQYAPDDQELLEQFTPVVPSRRHVDSEAVSKLIEDLRRLQHGLAPFPEFSRVPGGQHLHRLIGKSVRRDTAALASRIDSLTREVADSLEAILAVLRESVDDVWASHDGAVRQLQAMVTRQDEQDDRQCLHEERMSEHDVWIANREFRPNFPSLDFAERFRGSRAEMLLRYADVADLLVGTDGPVVDLGCGRGELIELIVAKGGAASGVEVDPELVEFCRSLFLDVTECSATDALLAANDDSFGGIALIQVVEHLTPQELVLLIPLARRKLRNGGLFVAETVNATSPFVFTRSFYADPTHTNPVHHEYLHFLLEQSGFSEISVQWRSVVDARDRLSEIPEEPYGQATDAQQQIVKDVNARLQRLDKFLFGPQDYLIVARK
jgi:SAM-dependent methyltransferase